MKLLHKMLVLLFGALLSLPVSAAEIVVIGNKSNTNVIDKAFVVKVYTGEAKYWPGGGAVATTDQAEDSPVRADFYARIVGRSASNMKALWAQNIFSGNGLPPKVVESDEDVKKMVSGNKNAIGYISSSSVDDTVKVLLK